MACPCVWGGQDGTQASCVLWYLATWGFWRDLSCELLGDGGGGVAEVPQELVPSPELTSSLIGMVRCTDGGESANIFFQVPQIGSCTQMGTSLACWRCTALSSAKIFHFRCCYSESRYTLCVLYLHWPGSTLNPCRHSQFQQITESNFFLINLPSEKHAGLAGALVYTPSLMLDSMEKCQIASLCFPICKVKIAPKFKTVLTPVEKL